MKIQASDIKVGQCLTADANLPFEQISRVVVSHGWVKVWLAQQTATAVAWDVFGENDMVEVFEN